MKTRRTICAARQNRSVLRRVAARKPNDKTIVPAAFHDVCLADHRLGRLGSRIQYSNTWQLVINTSTTIVTFLMVFLIQNTQNRDMAALHLKLDELIRVNVDARDKLLNIEDMTEAELQQLKGSFVTIASQSNETVEVSAVKADLENAKQDISAAEEKLKASPEDNK